MVLWPLSYGTNNEGSFRNEIEMVSLGWRRQQEPATDDHYRIGSDPPTVDGSLSAVDDFNEFASNNNNQHSAISEQELKCVPDNWSYFHSDSILNRRLRSGDNNTVSEAENGYGKWFSSNNEVSEAEPPEKVQELKYWDKDGLHGLHGFSIADFRNEIAGTLQSHLDRSVPPPRHPSNLASRSSSNKNVDSAETILLASPNVASRDSVLGTGSLSRSTPKEFWIIEKLLAHLHVRHNQLGSRYVKTSFGSSSSENLKISGKYFFDELSEIAGFILNLSFHQEGSRFIQEKLETASIEEKIMIYKEIVPYARELFNHMYGNYVIQKMLEHGMRTQRRKLVSMLYGHVLTLSQAIYGCRVIQKAIEVADMDQKIVMIQELDGYIIECVRDQNGNHVIHKCIKCIPEKYIQFIVESFFDKVVFLSTHIYGCRVIQRVLGHCKDPWTQRKFIEEILGSVSMLAQDQHGNYVVQHVIVNGKPHERSAVIKELAGEIVELSQQKYASNVVEKCLCYGNAQEREILVNEMLVYTADYDPLQVMMKDQFANYVVQKALEVCNDQQMRRIVSRCLASSDVLKRYSYGKHIVSRVEKLSATGEW